MLTLKNARIFDGHKMRGGTQSLTLDGNLIASADSDRGDSGHHETIDVQGMTVMPGLITCHLHPDFYQLSPGDPQGKEFPPGVQMALGIRTCRVLLESGFTGYVGASCAHDIDAQLKIAIAEGIISGPRIRACGHHIGTTGDLLNSYRWWTHQETPGTDLYADGPDALRKLVRQEIGRGVEIIKLFAGSGHGIPGRTNRNMATDEIAAVVTAAHDRGAMVRAHVATKDIMMECIKLGVDILDHGDEIDEECIEAMLEAGTFWVPSLMYPNCMLELSVDIAASTGIVQSKVDHVRRMLPIAHRLGVRILAGDDYCGIFRDALKGNPLDHQVGNYAREFEYYAGIDGLGPEDVLKWATSNAGLALLDSTAKVGVIEPGALADLIVVDGNPVEDLSLLTRPDQALKAVIRDGALVINRLPAQSHQAAA